MNKALQQIKGKVEPILRNYGIVRAGVFGSYARAEEKPTSDIDILIDLGKPIDLVQFLRLKADLEATLGKSVDLVCSDTIISYFEPTIRKELVGIYG